MIAYFLPFGKGVGQIFSKKRQARRPAFSAYPSLLDGDLPALGLGLTLLGQSQLQHAVFIAGADGVFLNTGDIEGTGEAAHTALPADILAVLILVLRGLIVLGGDGQQAILQVQVNVLLPEAGQVGLQQEVVALILNVGTEGGHLAAVHGEEAALKIIKQAVQTIIGVTSKGKQTIHNSKLLSGRVSAAPRRSLGPS